MSIEQLVIDQSVIAGVYLDYAPRRPGRDYDLGRFNEEIYEMRQRNPELYVLAQEAFRDYYRQTQTVSAPSTKYSLGMYRAIQDQSGKIQPSDLTSQPLNLLKYTRTFHFFDVEAFWYGAMTAYVLFERARTQNREPYVVASRSMCCEYLDVIRMIRLIFGRADEYALVSKQLEVIAPEFIDSTYGVAPVPDAATFGAGSILIPLCWQREKNLQPTI
jgi:hypothetical protein